ncbi:MAG: cohesin domain-containing protein [Candidatus Pacebacteria bacterium]|nr:cohesin domain-containing protein [Candidatus Paceibacterota bacterium]
MKNKKLKIINWRFCTLLSFVLFAGFYILNPSFLKASTLYFSSDSGTYQNEDTFIVDVRLDAEGENINTCGINIGFPKDYLQIVDISTGESILTLWPKSPAFSNTEGEISFIGGVPGGFSGDGKLVSLAFRAVNSAIAQINFNSDSQVLLNDGSGTPDKLNFSAANFTILLKTSDTVKNEWEEKISEDKAPPENFEIKLGKDKVAFSGKYFIAFFTTDAQTGIDHYEIKEGNGDWKIGQSPYLLEDQKLKSRIFVKAIDKAGNERISELVPSKRLSFYLIITLLIFGVFAIYWLVYRKKERKKIIK